jgi:hypothetical protein
MRSRHQAHWAMSAPLFVALAAAVPAGCSSDPDPQTGAGGKGSSGATTSSAGGSGGASCDLASAPSLDFPLSASCAPCHQGIYYDWASSMHARSITSPLMIAQTNQLFDLELNTVAAPDPQRLCVNCHSPLSTRFAQQATLPFKVSGCDAPIVPQEGIGCVTCHAYRGEPSPGKASTSAFLADLDLDPGSAYVGPLSDPAPSSFHKSEATPLFSESPEKLCKNCHDVALDLDNNGKIEKGLDLILASTFTEYEAYVKKGGKETCLGCHMPVKPGVTRASEAVGISAPDRVVHDHRFVGVNYQLDEVAANDPQRALREALLKDAATLVVSNGALKGSGDLTFDVSITSVKAGHNIPTGFAFLRQMWLDVRVLDKDQKELLKSGALRTPSDDLCDVTSLTDAVQFFVHGCLTSDPQLVNFQLHLINRIDVLKDASNTPILDLNGEMIPVKPFKAEETWVPLQHGGAVARTRPSDKQVLAPLAPGEARTFGYTFKLAPQEGPVTVAVRLRYRNFPPYIVRKLASRQPPGEVNLRQYLKDLQSVEIAAGSISVPVTP